MKPSISGQWNPPHGRKLRALWDGHLETLQMFLCCLPLYPMVKAPMMVKPPLWNYQGWLKKNINFSSWGCVSWKKVSRFCPTFRVLKPTAPNHGQSLVHKKFSSFAYGGFSMDLSPTHGLCLFPKPSWLGSHSFNSTPSPPKLVRRLQNSQVTLHGFQ